MLSRIFFGTVIFFASCKTNKKSPGDINTTNNSQIITGDTVSNFFPVTSYLRGEIFSIKTGGITPIKKTTVQKVTDSIWVKESDFETTFSAFLFPIIDTSNLKKTFTEKRFLDQTLNAFTFTYDPLNDEGNSFAFKHWDVYVDPETNKVRRIYLTKKLDADTELLLTWQSGKWCKIITVKNIGGKTTIIKEEKISWSYEE